MILYEVILDVEASLDAAVDEHMRLRHIPEIFATGCFRRIRFQRSSSHRFRTSSEAESATDLQRYLLDHAPRLRAEFLAEVPSGVGRTRETWHDLEQWG